MNHTQHIQQHSINRYVMENLNVCQTEIKIGDAQCNQILLQILGKLNLFNLQIAVWTIQNMCPTEI